MLKALLESTPPREFEGGVSKLTEVDLKAIEKRTSLHLIRLILGIGEIEQRLKEIADHSIGSFIIRLDEQ